MQLIHGDCLIESDKIETGSVDLILTDLPYGTMNGFNGIDWDFAIEPKKVYEIANRILRKNGKMVLFSSNRQRGECTDDYLFGEIKGYKTTCEKVDTML